jgi:hypothetical protein
MEKNQQTSPAMQQIGLLNLRVNDMMQQLNVVLKALMDENVALKAKVTELQCPAKEKAPAPKPKA